jgi:kynurenine 3-monooxygenase
MHKHVTLLGAGLTGPLLATYLVKRGFYVELYERRSDMRVHDVGGGRSINLALSTRGIHALEAVGIADEVLGDAIPMYGRMIHDLEGHQELQPYGTAGQAINSVSRAGLNIELMNAAERLGVKIHFSAKCSHVDLKNRTVEIENEATGVKQTITPGVVIATDGANSALRQAMEEQLPDFHSEVEWMGHGYKELSIPSGRGGRYLMEKNSLHIWPRHEFMMIALPNPDGSFTNTLFAPWEGPDGLNAIRSDDDVMEYFGKYFPDAIPLMPTLLEDWHRNPTSKLATVRCAPWYFRDWALLVGDSAHAVVPFYGQGMNACFEDCYVLDQLLAGNPESWDELFAGFYMSRKPNADAIADLALENFIEMRSKVVDPKFLRKKRIDSSLHEMFPDRWMPLYGMVTFSTIPYAEAQERERQQDNLLDETGYDVVENAIALGSERVEEVLWKEE